MRRNEGEGAAALPARASVTVRCYAELNDFLPPGRRHVSFEASYDEGGAVKDLLEGLGVPHTEIDLLLVNGESAAFDRAVVRGDRVAAFPVFESFDIAGLTRVRPEPLREVRFVLDGHLGRLAGLLRLAGFDAVYLRDAEDRELAAVSARERRVLLTRDQGLLKRRAVTHGSFVHATRPLEQLREVAGRFQLHRLVRPFTRCMRCNGRLRAASATAVAERVPRRSRECCANFVECEGCGQVYWEGSHYARLRRMLDEALKP